MSRGAGCRGPAIVIALVAVGLLWSASKCFEGWHYQRSIALIEYEMDQGLSSLAARHLTDVLDKYPGSDEALFLLGDCERARGRPQAAAEAWIKIKPDSRFAFRALEKRVELELEQGKVAEAEQIILRARDAARIAGPDPSLLLGPLYYRQGRVEEAMRSVEATWRAHSKSGGPASRTAIDQLRLYIQYRSSPIPYEVVRATLELAGRIAPDDDRIWLWKGTLAIAAGDYDEASRWLDRCQKMHAEDPAVWDARLDWAMATDHVLVAREALKHLPATEFSPAQVARVTAWFARERGDNESERRSLERLIALEPTDDAAFDRLIECSTKNGQPEVAVELGRRKADIGKLQARYRKLYARRQPRRDAAEMGRLAKQLGYRFEAEAFLAIAIALDLPDVRRDGTPLARSVQAPVGPARTAYDVLAPELNVVRQTGPTQSLKSDRGPGRGAPSPR